MDDPDSDRSRLLATLAQFRLTNRLFSRYRTLLTRYLIRDMKLLTREEPASSRGAQRGSGRPFTVLEIGAGGCDVAIWLAGACRRHGLQVHITCIDNDSRIARYALRRILASGVSDRIEFLQLSAFDVDQLPDYDYVICRNTLHHFTEDQTCTLLRLMEKKAARRYSASDLARSPAAWIAFWVFSSIFLHGSFARYDGLLSLARAFVLTELHALVPAGGKRTQPRVRRLFPALLHVVGAGTAKGG